MRNHRWVHYNLATKTRISFSKYFLQRVFHKNNFTIVILFNFGFLSLNFWFLHQFRSYPECMSFSVDNVIFLLHRKIFNFDDMNMLPEATVRCANTFGLILIEWILLVAQSKYYKPEILTLIQFYAKITQI